MIADPTCGNSESPSREACYGGGVICIAALAIQPIRSFTISGVESATSLDSFVASCTNTAK